MRVYLGAEVMERRKMTEQLLWLSVTLLVLQCPVTRGSLQEQIVEYSELCCTAGIKHALQSPDCSSAMPPRDVPQHLGSLCLAAMDGCCKERIKDQKECEKGKLLSPSKECAHVTSDIGQNCCEECSLGRLAGTSQGSGACGGGGSGASEGEEDGGSSMVLRKQAYTACCLEAAAKQEAPPPQPAIPPVRGADAASLCEKFAPDELCAHHCIPVPGSYRCECRPGFMLMADGKSCKKVEKNRCKPRNPCQHNCNDNGKEVRCTCRRGYELMADNKSCRDVDECALKPSVCPGTVCRNTDGSYKCLPGPPPTPNAGSCPVGFKRNMLDQVCDDINECDLPAPPCARSICSNTIGGYTCGGVVGKPYPPPAAKPLAATTTASADNVQDLCPNGFRIGSDGECVDIDECAEKSSDCNDKSQFCLNTHGSFACQDRASKHCPPGFKINTASGVCQDIDECADSTVLCGPELVCVNVAGAYDCKKKGGSGQNKLPKSCPEGTRMNPGSKICEDIDECREGSHLCDKHQDCVNSYAGHECRCRPGFRLSTTTGACEDVNECAEESSNTCLANTQRCDNTVGSYVCTRFTSCGTGYVLHASSGQCEDIDECAHKLDACAQAGADFACVNLPGTFRCVRRRGATSTTSTTSTLSPMEYEYYDSDEEIPTDEIKPNDLAPTTPPPTTPHPSPTSASTGPPLTAGSEPTTSEPPSKTNTDEGTTTEHAREASTTPIAPTPPPTTSLPPRPSIPPRQSVPEMTPTPAVRKNNETVVVHTGSLPKNTWTNLVPFDSNPIESKHCIGGFQKNSLGDCVDVDECSTGAHVCSSLTERCRNTEGSYLCDCAPGFTKDTRSGSCKALTQTTTSTTTGRPPPTQTPVAIGGQGGRRRGPWSPTSRPYRPFRPRLACDVGYRHNSTTGKCEDLNECSAGTASCAAHEMCVNTEGGYRCECPPGWQLDTAGHRCVRARDPEQFPPGYHNINTESPRRVTPKPTADVASGVDKVITVGSQYGNVGAARLSPNYRQLDNGAVLASCPWGYHITDAGQCEDVNECETGAAECGPTQLCSNHMGGYSCRCPPGHRLAHAVNTCEDIDECAISQGKYCGPHSDCVNTVGSYLCRCRAGFRASPTNDKVCVDVDECADAVQGSICQHTCNNAWGSYRCSCHRGFRLAADNRSCIDVDECADFSARNLCVGRCLNEPGSYRCSCPSGYRLGLDGRSCIDIDECETGEATCAGAGATADRVCQNTRGGYKCHQISCLPGYLLEKKHRCTRIARYCSPEDVQCQHTPATYSYNFITFVSHLYIPPSPADSVDLFTMRGPSYDNSRLQFDLRLVNVNAPPSVKRVADIGCFRMVATSNQAVVSLLESLEGPQSIELELSMQLYLDAQPAIESYGVTVIREPFGGIAVAKILIYVSEYEF